MSNKKKTRLTIAASLILLICVLSWLSSGDPETYPPYLSESPSPTGVKAFYTWLDEERQVQKWESLPELLPDTTTPQTLLMVEPFSSLSQNEIHQYEQWMEEGNTIWLMKNNPAGYFGVSVDYGASPSLEAIVEDGEGNTYAATVQKEYRLRSEEKDEVVLEDDQGVLALERPYGQGALLVSINPNWLANGNILERDHYGLVTSLLERQENERVWFDEYVHGEEGVFSGLTVYPHWLLVLTVQLMLLTILFLWMRGKRFGPIFTPREDVVRFGDERLQALASWYKKGEFYRESLSIQEAFVRARLQERFGVSATSTWQEIRQTLSYRLDEDSYKKWERWTKAVEPLEHMTEVDKKTYLEWSHKLDQMRREVQEA